MRSKIWSKTIISSLCIYLEGSFRLCWNRQCWAESTSQDRTSYMLIQWNMRTLRWLAGGKWHHWKSASSVARAKLLEWDQSRSRRWEPHLADCKPSWFRENHAPEVCLGEPLVTMVRVVMSFSPLARAARVKNAWCEKQSNPAQHEDSSSNNLEEKLAGVKEEVWILFFSIFSSGWLSIFKIMQHECN